MTTTTTTTMTPSADATAPVWLDELVQTARAVKEASRQLARTSAAQRDDALRHMARALRERLALILEANARDVAQAQAKGLTEAFIDRLRLTPERVEEMAQAIEEIVTLPDPIGRVDQLWRRPNGLMVGKQRIPLGVIAIIYEARPNVTSDAAALCLKSGNAVLLKGGSDAFWSNQAVAAALRQGLERSALPPQAQAAVGFVQTTEREAVQTLLKLDDCLDLVIPRGGKALVRFVHEHSRVPVIKHDEGVCHLVIDASARDQDVDAILLNAKTQRPSACNAIETLLVLQSAAQTHLPRALRTLHQAGVHLHLCPRSAQAAQQLELPAQAYSPADDAAYAREFLSLDLAVRVVADLDEAIAHIDRFGSNHTESLLTQDYAQSQRFLAQVHSAVVMINASTRFSDGGQLGLGAEIGISTTRMHAYGPMGLESLTTTKFIIMGDGQIR